MSLAENIKRLRRQRGLTQAELAAQIGVGATSVSNWERGDTEPLMGRVRAMAEIFAVPLESILGGASIVAEDSSRYGAACAAPLYGKIAAGTPIEKLPVDEELWIPSNIKCDHPKAFFLEVKGESMNRVLPNGFFALVDPDAEFVSGDVMAVNVNGNDATIKRVYRGAESITLAPESYDSRFEEERFTDPEIVTPIGRVVWMMPPYGKRL